MSTTTAGATASRRRHSLTDAKSPFSVCPLMSNRIQLLPLRYGMVDLRYNDWDHWTEGLAYQLRVLSEPDAPLALGFEIYPNELNASHGLAIKLRYPQMVDKVIYREQCFETTSLNITSFNVINEVSMLRVRVMDAPWIIITHDVLASAAECQYKGALS